MEIFNHPNCITIIGRPADMTDAECAALPARTWRDDQGPWTSTYWRPDADELAALVAGGAVAVNLRVGYGQHPVMFVSTYMKEWSDG